jgi:uncharacterized glyoxalase superfamily protein PhnB
MAAETRRTPVKRATAYASGMYEDAATAIEWLELTLGFERIEFVTDDDGAVVHAEVALGGTVVMLGTTGAGREPFASLPGGPSMIYIAVDEIDQLHDFAVEGGAEVVVPLTDTDYGSRDFAVRDPEGHIWSFGTYRPGAGA